MNRSGADLSQRWVLCSIYLVGVLLLLLLHVPSGAYDPGDDISYNRSNVVTEKNTFLLENRYSATQKTMYVNSLPDPTEILPERKLKIFPLYYRYQESQHLLQ